MKREGGHYVQSLKTGKTRRVKEPTKPAARQPRAKRDAEREAERQAARRARRPRNPSAAAAAAGPAKEPAGGAALTPRPPADGGDDSNSK
ncbi:MAG: hypothetical protein Q7V31_03775 [Parvibaculum sp.]|uniref:hypothetical protein n=1 Tax=Parvibaculum sp. TaxID=2024848 RepID=UPI002719A17F|nr:hypothetical protein [Parvibaculum sp.]MDO8838022.1 hypothetical protein [Parvibaculum sp.]